MRTAILVADANVDSELGIKFSLAIKAVSLPQDVADAITLELVRRVNTNSDCWFTAGATELILLLETVAPQASDDGLEAVLPVTEIVAYGQLELLYVLTNAAAGRQSQSIWEHLVTLAARFENELDRKIALVRLAPVLPAETVQVGYRAAQSRSYS
jgi:hypothetical protein